MKLHEIARQARALGIVMGENSGNRERQEKLLEMLHFNSGNFKLRWTIRWYRRRRI